MVVIVVIVVGVPTEVVIEVVIEEEDVVTDGVRDVVVDAGAGTDGPAGLVSAAALLARYAVVLVLC